MNFILLSISSTYSEMMKHYFSFILFGVFLESEISWMLNLNGFKKCATGMTKSSKAREEEYGCYQS